MTTSDDDALYDDPDATADQPVDLMAEDTPPPLAAPSTGKAVLAVLLAVVVALVGVGVWAVIFAMAEREYVGVAVVIGLTVGWVLRVVSGRTSLPMRIAAVVITAAACVLGTLVGDSAYNANYYDIDFVKVLKDLAPETFDTFSKRPTLSFVIFAAAVVLAFLAAGPQKPKAKKEPQVAPIEPIDADPPHPGVDDEP